MKATTTMHIATRVGLLTAVAGLSLDFIVLPSELRYDESLMATIRSERNRFLRARC